jgi:hypothetical protein
MREYASQKTIRPLLVHDLEGDGLRRPALPKNVSAHDEEDYNGDATMRRCENLTRVGMISGKGWQTPYMGQVHEPISSQTNLIMI